MHLYVIQQIAFYLFPLPLTGRLSWLWCAARPCQLGSMTTLMKTTRVTSLSARVRVGFTLYRDPVGLIK